MKTVDQLAHRYQRAILRRLTSPPRTRRKFDLETFDVLHRLRRCDRDDLIIDVGANDGRTALRLRRYLPRTKIIAVEPVASTFRKLQKNTAQLPDIELVQIAFGASEMARNIHIGQNAALNSLDPDFQPSTHTETVQVETLDSFAGRRKLSALALLKIDTEGHDLEVLRGSNHFLRQGVIELVMVEAGFGAPGVRQTSLEEIRRFLAERAYYLSHIVNQTRGRSLARVHGPKAPSVLTYCDAIFLRGKPRAS